MKSKLLIVATFVFFFGATSQAQENPEETNKKIFNQYVQSLKNTPNTKLFTETALFFIGSPYKAGTLDMFQHEYLVNNLMEFDCTTLIESCIALYRSLRIGTAEYDEYTFNLQQIRYRNGAIRDYTSRLHYMTDWITDNVSKGIVLDRTKSLGGIPMNVNVNYMSTHPQLYPALKKDPRNIAKIEVIERNINSRENVYYYIPNENIKTAEKNIKTGDILFFTTSIKGLDVMHAGIAYWENKELTFIHASSQHKKVIINPEPLTDYCRKNNNITGIMVVAVR